VIDVEPCDGRFDKMLLGSVNPKLDKLDTSFTSEATAVQSSGLSPGMTTAEETAMAVSTNQEKNGQPSSATQSLLSPVRERRRVSVGKKLKQMVQWLSRG
jgi:hypothetical protein